MDVVRGHGLNGRSIPAGISRKGLFRDGFQLPAEAEAEGQHGGGDSGAAFGLFEFVFRLGVVGSIDQFKNSGSVSRWSIISSTLPEFLNLSINSRSSRSTFLSSR